MDDNFYGEFSDYCDYLDECLDNSEAEDAYWEDSVSKVRRLKSTVTRRHWMRLQRLMDGDHDSAMRDAGFGTDEDYGLFDGDDY